MRVLAGLLSLISLIACVSPLSAQDVAYKWDAGASIGLGGYLGEYSRSNPMAHAGFRASVWGAYVFDSRWSFQAMAGYSGISGDLGGVGGVLPADAPTYFRSAVGDLSVRAEFNFFAYGEGETFKHLSRWTPYVAAGAGAVAAVPHGSSCKVAPLLPMAIGVKFRIKPRLNLRGEFSMAKSFTDGLDGSADLCGIAGSRIKNTDWLSMLTVGISYEFGERCATCHYFD